MDMRKNNNITLLLYYFRDNGEKWIESEKAIRNTWTVCGRSAFEKTVVVCNKKHDEIIRFAQMENIDVQVCDKLIPGDIATMSRDCIENLHQRFSTEYVLIVQEDGYPLGNGRNLSDFVGKYDYIGAPCIRDSRRKAFNLFGFYGLNGGFSLRSKRICRRAANAWRFLSLFGFSERCPYSSEDTFYTVTAMLLPWYRFGLKFPKEDEAFAFSYDDLDGFIQPPEKKPFGFHRNSSLKKIK